MASNADKTDERIVAAVEDELKDLKLDQQSMIPNIGAEIGKQIATALKAEMAVIKEEA